MKKGDKWVLISLIVLLCASIPLFVLYQWGNRDQGAKAIIKQNKVIIDEVVLLNIQEPRIWEVRGENGAYNKIEAQNGQIRFLESNCPDQVCVQVGWIPRSGIIAVCLPNRVSIEIDHQGIIEVDDVTY